MRKPLFSDLPTRNWAILEPMIPVWSVGRPREVSITSSSTRS